MVVAVNRFQFIEDFKTGSAGGMFLSRLCIKMSLKVAINAKR